MLLKDIESYYCESFYPLSSISDSNQWEDSGLVSQRISVFPKFLNNFKELQENVDNADDYHVALYRKQFLGFLTSLAAKVKMFKKEKSSIELYEFFSPPNEEDVILLSEKNLIDIYIPELSIIFLGHDDFGFILLSDGSHSSLTIINTEIAKHKLFLLNTDIVV